MVEETDYDPKTLPPTLELERARDLLPAYLAGRLAAAELEAFECYLFEHPEFLDELEAVEALREGLQSLQQEAPAIPARATDERAANDSSGSPWSRWGQVASFALAGSVLLNLWLLQEPVVDADGPVGIGSELLLSLRSSAPPTARLDSLRGQALLLRVDLGRASPAAYRIEVTTPSDERLRYPVRYGAEDVLHLVLENPTAGSYRLRLDQSRQPDDETTWQRFRDVSFDVR